jgi:hypothetical protein
MTVFKRCSVVLVAALLIVGCATGSQVRSPQANVAKYGGDLMASVSTIQKAVAGMKLPEAPVATVMATFEKIGDAGQKLSGLLTIYDSTVNVAAKIKQAKDIGAQLEIINSLLAQLLVPITSEDARAQVSKMLANSYNLLLTIKGSVLMLNAPSGAPSTARLEVSWQA